MPQDELTVIVGVLIAVLIAIVALYAIYKSGKLRVNLSRGETRFELEAGREEAAGKPAMPPPDEHPGGGITGDISQVDVLGNARVQGGNVNVHVGHAQTTKRAKDG